MAGIKIVDLPPLGRDLASTDLLELSLAGGTGSRKITGQEIMNASKLSVNNTPIINGTVGRILFQGTGDVLQQSSSLFWDAPNDRLIVGSTGGNGVIAFPNTTSGYSPIIQSQFGGNNIIFTIGGRNFTINGSGTITTNFNTTITGSTGAAALVVAQGSSAWTPVADFNGSSGTALRVNTNGNILIGTTTDAGFKLDVNGQTRIKSDNGSASGWALTVVNSSDTQLMRVRNDGSLHVGFTGDILSFYGAVNNNIIKGNQSIQYQSNGGTVQRNFHWFTNSNVFTATVEDIPHVVMGASFAPTSGVSQYTQLVLNPTINQTGGANGITRGLYINPTLTAAADFRAIETTAGNVLFNGGNVGVRATIPSTLGANQVYLFAGLSTHLQGSLNASETALNNNIYWDGLNLRRQVTGFCQSLYFDASGDLQYNNAVSGANGTIPTVNTRMVIKNNGNVLIGTTTDAGFRLDVNGTARFSGNTTVSGSITLGTNQSLGDGNFSINVNRLESYNAYRIRTLADNRYVYLSPGNTDIFYANYWAGGNFAGVVAQDTAGTIQSTSAVLQANSTTRGFLPPRMTQAQRNAIASPAIGLEIYQTDATEGKYIYKSSGWTYIG